MSNSVFPQNEDSRIKKIKKILRFWFSTEQEFSHKKKKKKNSPTLVFRKTRILAQKKKKKKKFSDSGFPQNENYRIKRKKRKKNFLRFWFSSKREFSDKKKKILQFWFSIKREFSHKKKKKNSPILVCLKTRILG